MVNKHVCGLVVVLLSEDSRVEGAVALERLSRGGCGKSATGVFEVTVYVVVIQLHDLNLVGDDRESITLGFGPRDVNLSVVEYASDLRVNRLEVGRCIR